MAGAPALAMAAGYGRLAGIVRDQHGDPLMGATVLVTGPNQGFLGITSAAVERVTTDAYGRFTIEHLVPGWYSLQVVSPARIPALRDRVRVAAGRTTQQNFVLGDILSALGLQKSRAHFSTWGEDWKWILRTSASTRPILRFRKVDRASTQKPKLPLTPSRRLIGVLPGSVHQDGLSEDPGMGSVLAYLRPLSQDSDLLVAGSLGSSGTSASSFAAAIRRNMVSGDPQEISIVVHQLSLDQGVAIAVPAVHGTLASAQGMVVTYSRTRRLSNAVSLTAGVEADYLNSVSGVAMVQPQVELTYQFDPSTQLAFHIGAPQSQSSQTLVERLDTLGAFPRITMQGYRPRMENVRHVEVAVEHRWGKTSHFQVAAYSDFFRNAAVWGFGEPADWVGMAGNFLPDSNGVVLNAGNYRSAGVQAGYERSLGHHYRVGVMYSLGDSLAPIHTASSLLGSQFVDASQIASRLRPQRTQAISGKLTARLPVSHAQIVTSYTWLTAGSVTVVDPYGLAQAGMEPYLGIQIRQPLPAMAFLPAHIEALAEFRNLLDEGTVLVNEPNGKPILLTPAYRTLRGGFSVQF
jgi:hypothetical protein